MMPESGRSYRRGCLLGGVSSHKAHDERIRELEAELAEHAEHEGGRYKGWRNSTTPEYRRLTRDWQKALVEIQTQKTRAEKAFAALDVEHQEVIEQKARVAELERLRRDCWTTVDCGICGPDEAREREED